MKNKMYFEKSLDTYYIRLKHRKLFFENLKVPGPTGTGMGLTE